MWQLQMAKYLNVTQFGMQYCVGKPLQQRLEAIRYRTSEKEGEGEREREQEVDSECVLLQYNNKIFFI